MWFKAYHEFDHGKSMDVSNYLARFNPETCIGCGVCAYKCPTKSIALEQRGKTTDPPADINEYVGRFIMDFSDPLPRRKV